MDARVLKLLVDDCMHGATPETVGVTDYESLKQFIFKMCNGKDPYDCANPGQGDYDKLFIPRELMATLKEKKFIPDPIDYKVKGIRDIIVQLNMPVRNPIGIGEMYLKLEIPFRIENFVSIDSIIESLELVLTVADRMAELYA